MNDLRNRGMNRGVRAGFVFVFGLTLLVLGAHAGEKKVRMPEFAGIAHWLNTEKPTPTDGGSVAGVQGGTERPLTAESLKGKVVLVDFWTYTCINCIRTFPHVEAWHEKYRAQGLEIVGIHTPEFAFEMNLSNVQAAVKTHGIRYPVGLDNDYKTWNAYANRFWPAHYLFDREGYLRYQHLGEGNYDVTEREIQELLAEGGSASPTPQVPMSPTSAGPPVTTAINPMPPDADFSRINTPEMYFGYARLSSLGNTERIRPGVRQTLSAPKKLSRKKFYLVGDWKVEKEFARLESSTGKILLRFDASKANLVVRTIGEQEVVAEILIDGRPATDKNKGSDVILEKDRAICRFSASRMYNLAAAGYGDHILEIRFLSAGAEVYVFTFG